MKPAFFQPLDALHDGGAREAHVVGDGLVTGAAVGGEDLEDPAGGGIDGGGGHWGSDYMLVVPVYKYLRFVNTHCMLSNYKQEYVLDAQTP